MKLLDLITEENRKRTFRFWGKSPWWNLYEQGDCKYLKHDVLTVFELIAIFIYLKYPDRVDRCLGVGDASTNSLKQPDSHPLGFHVYGNSQDLYYYTLEGINKTQGEDAVEIWDEESLDLAKFDAERNAELVNKISLCFPNAAISPSSGIKEAIETHLGKEMDALIADDTPAYQHRRHLHVSHGKQINWDAELCELEIEG